MTVTERMLDDLVDIWHSGDSDLSLAEFLGMTREEYGYWTKEGFEAWRDRYSY